MLQPSRRFDEHRVADLVAERVVDDLEMVEIEHEHPDEPLAAAEAPQRLVHAVGEEGAVGEPGQRVRQRKALDGCLGVFELTDLTHQRLGFSHDAAQRIMDRLALVLELGVPRVLANRARGWVTDQLAVDAGGHSGSRRLGS
ncbi:MAG: hypothetical protein JF886_04615 [Candidatus Dormibacteraeota bacterium]|uniref:Uncharacterized protein n=1 Tax=Candidatus Aeolococcus gillhamiae TaxID=3127015 RepID=A0A934JYY9_9BACT|nr:hypothetical protein [Candidatus Dormibacteraeota bacterium]